MRTISITSARADLYNLIDKASETSEPIYITGKRNNAVLVSDKDWRAIEETMYLLSIPGMRESIIEGNNTPIEECFDDPGW
jgi:prevent-host-death family protein